MESEGIHKAVKDALISEKEATKRRSLSPSLAAISDRDRMMMDDELEKSC